MQNKFKKAFTLIELLIVIAIIAILTVAFLPGALKAPARARDAGKVKKVQDIVAAVEAYNAQKMSYPTDTANQKTCFTQVVADFVNIELPVDSTKLNSCNLVGQEDKFLYVNGSGFYVVGAKVEIDSAANTFLASGDLTALVTPASITAPKSFLNKVKSPQNNLPYYLVVGP